MESIDYTDCSKAYNKEVYLGLFKKWLGNIGYKESPDANGYSILLDDKGTLSSNKLVREYKLLGECPSFPILEIKCFLSSNKLSNSKSAEEDIDRYIIGQEIVNVVKLDNPNATKALVLLIPCANKGPDTKRSKKEKINDYRLVYVPSINGEDKCRALRLGACARKNILELVIGMGAIESLEDLDARFNMVNITRQFIEKLHEWYNKAVPIMAFPRGNGKLTKMIVYSSNPGYIRIRAKWFLLRMVSLMLIREKYNRELNGVLDETAVSSMLASDINLHSLRDGRYYNAILQNLFFVALSSPVKRASGSARDFTSISQGKRNEDYGIKNKFRDNKGKSYFSVDHKVFVKMMEGVPYIGGGIFSCQDCTIDPHTVEYRDGFSREPSRRAFIPNATLFGSNKGGGLLGLLDSYNFSIDEEDSYYNKGGLWDLAIDPRILPTLLDAIDKWNIVPTISTQDNSSNKETVPTSDIVSPTTNVVTNKDTVSTIPSLSTTPNTDAIEVSPSTDSIPSTDTNGDTTTTTDSITDGIISVSNTDSSKDSISMESSIMPETTTDTTHTKTSLSTMSSADTIEASPSIDSMYSTDSNVDTTTMENSTTDSTTPVFSTNTVSIESSTMPMSSIDNTHDNMSNGTGILTGVSYSIYDNVYGIKAIATTVDLSLKDYFTTVLKDETKVKALFCGNTEGLSQEDKDAIVQAIRDIRVIDPLCKSGEMLIAMLERLEGIWELVLPIETGSNARYKRELAILKYCLYGVDISSQVIEVLRLRLYMRLLSRYHKTLLLNKEYTKDNKDDSNLPDIADIGIFGNRLIAGSIFRTIKTGVAPYAAMKDKEDLDVVIDSFKEVLTLTQRHELEVKEEKLRLSLVQHFTQDMGCSKEDANMIICGSRPNSIPLWFNAWWMLGLDNYNIVLSMPDYRNRIDILERMYNKNKIDVHSQGIFLSIIDTLIDLVRTGGKLAILIPNNISFSEEDGDCISALYKLLDTRCANRKLETMEEGATLVLCDTKTAL